MRLVGRILTKIFFTIMSYPCQDAYCERVMRMSSSDESNRYSNKAIGDFSHDNARQINKRSVTVANYRKSTTIPTSFPTSTPVQSPVEKPHFVNETRVQSSLSPSATNVPVNLCNSETDYTDKKGKDKLCSSLSNLDDKKREKECKKERGAVANCKVSIYSTIGVLAMFIQFLKLKFI